MKRFIFTISIILFASTVFISCKKTDKKDNTGQPSGTNDPDGNFFNFKENGTLYKMEYMSMGTGNTQSANPIKEFSGGTTVDSYLLPKRNITINFPSSVSPKTGEFVIGGPDGIYISYSIQQSNITTNYKYNQHGTLILEDDLSGFSTKGTLEFVGYTYDGTDSVVVTEGKFAYEVP